ncbi:hypothetical protein pb186bvf_019271 [Paramecium bursaria]
MIPQPFQQRISVQFMLSGEVDSERGMDGAQQKNQARLCYEDYVKGKVTIQQKPFQDNRKKKCLISYE